MVVERRCIPFFIGGDIGHWDRGGLTLRRSRHLAGHDLNPLVAVSMQMVVARHIAVRWQDLISGLHRERGE
jgi:hypothetical protein